MPAFSKKWGYKELCMAITKSFFLNFSKPIARFYKSCKQCECECEQKSKNNNLLGKPN